MIVFQLILDTNVQNFHFQTLHCKCSKFFTTALQFYYDFFYFNVIRNLNLKNLAIFGVFIAVINLFPRSTIYPFTHLPTHPFNYPSSAIVFLHTKANLNLALPTIHPSQWHCIFQGCCCLIKSIILIYFNIDLHLFIILFGN